MSIRDIEYQAPDIYVVAVEVERGFVASEEYGAEGEAGNGYDDIYNGIF